MTRAFLLRASLARAGTAAAIAACGALLASTAAFAQVEGSRPFAAPAAVTSADPSGIASLGQVTLALGFVLALIFVAAWLLKRMRGFGRNGGGALDILADLPVGQKERAVLVRVGTTQVLLGVAPGRVTTLHVLPEPIDITPPGGSMPSASPGSFERPTFRSILMKSLGKP